MRFRGIILNKDIMEQQKYNAEFFRNVIIFFAGVFFTCVIGIIELLPVFETTTGHIGQVTITFIYFGLLGGILYSMNKCFWLYEQNRIWGGRYGFNFPDIELLRVWRYHLKKNELKALLNIAFLSLFSLMYLVKIGFLA